MIQNARSLDEPTSPESGLRRVQKWLEGLSDEELGKYKM